MKPCLEYIGLNIYKFQISSPHLLKQNFHELHLFCSDYEHIIYTDGSKDEEKVGCVAAKYDDCKTMRFLDGSSVFTALMAMRKLTRMLQYL